MAFGLINVSFYTTDILLWFGLNGLIVCLSYVWKLKAKWMLVLGLFLILMGPVTNNFLREILFPDINISQRYLNNTTITDIITYPFVEVLKGFIRTFAGTSTLGYMIVGYSLAQMGYAFRLDQIANIKIALICTVTYFIVYLILRATGTPLLISIWHLTGVALYMILIVIASHKLHFISGLMGKYGKMTLTHYTCQEVLMPCIMPLLIIPNHMDFVLLLIVGLLLYTFQVLFSYYWLQVHKYGPLEYLWRKCS